MNSRYDDGAAALEQRLRAHYAAEYADTPDGPALWYGVARRAGLADAGERTTDLGATRRATSTTVRTPEPGSSARPPRAGRRERRATGGLRATLAVAAAALIVAMSFAIFHFANPRQGAGNGPIPSDALISDVQMLSPDNGWAVGSSDQQQRAIVLHFMGGQWRLAASFASARLEQISMVSPTEGWAVGLDAAFNSDGHSHRSFLIHYSGGRWVQVPAPFDDAAAIHMLSADTGYMVGDGTVTDPSGMTTSPDVLALYDHGHWRRSTLPTDLFPIALSSLTDGWAAGDNGQLWHFQDGTWSLSGDTLPSSVFPLGLQMLSPTDGWAAGYEQTGVVTTKGVTVPGKPFLMHYDGTSWQQVAVPEGLPENSMLDHIHMDSPTSGWAWGRRNNTVPAVLLHYSAGSWRQVPLPAGNTARYGFYSVSSVSPTEAWATADDGNPTNRLLHWQDGAWTVYAP